MSSRLDARTKHPVDAVACHDIDRSIENSHGVPQHAGERMGVAEVRLGCHRQRLHRSPGQAVEASLHIPDGSVKVLHPMFEVAVIERAALDHRHRWEGHRLWQQVVLIADSNEGGHLFQSDRGHHSNLMAASLVSSRGPVLVMS
jgi:hypothetical protein